MNGNKPQIEMRKEIINKMEDFVFLKVGDCENVVLHFSSFTIFLMFASIFVCQPNN